MPVEIRQAFFYTIIKPLQNDKERKINKGDSLPNFFVIKKFNILIPITIRTAVLNFSLASNLNK